MSLDDWKVQIRRGTLELCILLMIRQAPCYGYQLISALETRPSLAVKESTIYPLLRRLMKEGVLTSFWQETTEGLPPRKYYSITDQGREYLAAMCVEWKQLTDAIIEIKGAMQDE